MAGGGGGKFSSLSLDKDNMMLEKKKAMYLLEMERGAAVAVDNDGRQGWTALDGGGQGSVREGHVDNCS